MELCGLSNIYVRNRLGIRGTISDMVTTSKAVSRYLSRIGKKGGEAGRGDNKRRDVAFYRSISRKGLKARRANAKARRETEGAE